MAGKADELAREPEGEPQGRILAVEAERPHLAILDRLGAPAPDGLGEPLGHVGREAQGLADLADGAARAIADHGRRETRALTTVFRIDVLNHLLAPLVLEVDVDVGGLVPLGADEALE